MSDQTYVTWDNFGAGGENSGEYDLTATTSNDESGITITIDRVAPTVSKENEVEYVPNDPSIGFTVSDDYSDVVDMTVESTQSGIEVDNSDREDICGAGGECTENFDLTTDEISNGDEFILDVTATDGVGHTFDDSFSYTYDDSFEADEPEFSVSGADDEDDVHVTDDVEVDVTVGNVDEETSDVRVSCFVDGEELDQTDWDDSEDFSCDLPEDDIEDGDADVSVEACDRAGNCDSSDERSFTFDSTPPVMDSFSTVQEYTKFGGSFDVEFEAEDSDSGLQSAEYFFSTAVLPGEGNDVELDGDSEFTVEESSFPNDDTEQTVYMRVMNDVGQWSDYQEIDFEYYPDAEPSVSVSAPENFSVTAGSSKEFEVTVENTGTLMIGSVNVSVSSDLFTDSSEITDLRDSSKTAVFDISPNETEIGEYTLDVETDGPVDSTSTSLVVEANNDQQQEVESMLENYSTVAEGLESNISTLRSGGLDEDLNRSLEENVTPFMQRVERAQSFADQGDYYRAYSVLEGIEEVRESAEQTFSEVREQDRIQERNRMLMMVLGGFLVVAVGGGVFVYSRDGLEFDPSDYGLDEYRLPETGPTGETVSGAFDAVREKISELTDKLEQEEEEVEQKFQGFN